MLIEVKVTRIDDKIVGLETNNHLRSIPPTLPLYTRSRVKVSIYHLPPAAVESFYHKLRMQLEEKSM